MNLSNLERERERERAFRVSGFNFSIHYRTSSFCSAKHFWYFKNQSWLCKPCMVLKYFLIYALLLTNTKIALEKDILPKRM
jgi:hypothetical protein